MKVNFSQEDWEKSYKNQGPIKVKTFFVLEKFEKKHIEAKKIFKVWQKDFRSYNSTCPARGYQAKNCEKEVKFWTVYKGIEINTWTT